MTFCVAWKTESAAFIIADSVVTQIKGASDTELSKTSSFMEKQGFIEDDKYSYEGAYKLFSTDACGFSIAGDKAFGIDFVSNVINQIEIFKRSVEEAIHFSLQNYPDFSSYPQIEIIIITFDSKPRMFTVFNQRKTNYLKEEFEPIVTGTPLQGLKQEFLELFDGSLKYWESDPSFDRDEIFFVKILALLQSYGINYYTLGAGVGGSYTGLLVNSEGIVYQPDVCYLLTGENPEFDSFKFAMVSVEKEAFSVVNTDMPSLYIENDLSTSCDSTSKTLLERTINNFDAGRFKYLILINCRRFVSVIIDMNFSDSHALVITDVIKERKGRLGLYFSGQIFNLLNDGFETLPSEQKATIYYIPFIAASRKDLNFIDELKKSPRISKQIDLDRIKYKFIIYKDGFEDSYYGGINSIFPFVSEFKGEKLIRVVDTSSDFVIFEYENGVIIYPEYISDTKEILDSIQPRLSIDNIYMFDVYGTGDDPIYIEVMARNEEQAIDHANVKVNEEFGCNKHLIYSGKFYYHPAYYHLN